MGAKMPFLEKLINMDEGRSIYDGIMGLAPRDESAGPLLIDYLYEQGKVDRKMVSLLPSRQPSDLPKITYGGYQREDDEPKFYNGA